MTEDLDKDRYRHPWEEDLNPRPARPRRWIALALAFVFMSAVAMAAGVYLLLGQTSREEPVAELEIGAQSEIEEEARAEDGPMGLTDEDLAGAEADEDASPAVTASPEAAEQTEVGEVAGGSPGVFAGEPGRIAIIDSDSRLLTISPDGSAERLLSAPGRFYQFPAWSPDGDRLAVIGSDFDGSGVYFVSDADGEQMQPLFEDREQTAIYLFWSPDGQQVSFIARHPEGLALHLAPAQSGGVDEILTISPSTLFWNWLPDGRQVLVHKGFTAGAGDRPETVFVPIDSAGELETVILEEGSGPFQMPAVAKDGRYYAVSDIGPDGSSFLKIFRSDTHRPGRAIPHLGAIAMGWSPTGDPLLAFTSPERPSRTFYGPLQVMDADSGAVNPLTTDVIVAFFWSPDGRSIAYLTLRHIIRPDEEDAIELGGTEVLAPAQTAGKNGRLAKPVRQEARRIILDLWVVDVENGNSRLLSTFEPSNTFLNQFMPFFDQYAQSHRLWSPDSRFLVLPMKRGEGLSEIVIVPANGDPAIPLAPGVAAFWSHQ